MISAYGGIRWGTGMSRAFQYQKTQCRIGAPPWDAPLQFIENSPIFWVKKIQTPYLTIHNDEDDAVPWEQGIEWITALRRLGKEGYMFNFNGERHGLRNRDNMKHWTVHMDEFFDHYLLGKPRPEWMDKGVPFLERGKRDVTPLFKKKTAATPTTQRRSGSETRWLRARRSCLVALPLAAPAARAIGEGGRGGPDRLPRARGGRLAGRRSEGGRDRAQGERQGRGRSSR